MKVAIIGAGASGIASARRAIEYNLETTVFEEKSHIGGIWKYCENTDSSSSPIYVSLRYRYAIISLFIFLLAILQKPVMRPVFIILFFLIPEPTYRRS